MLHRLTVVLLSQLPAPDIRHVPEAANCPLGFWEMKVGGGWQKERIELYTR